MYRLGILILAFVASLSWLYFLASNAPELPDNDQLQFPSSLGGLKKTASLLSELFHQVLGKFLNSFSITTDDLKNFYENVFVIYN
jgi:hypothetical protein